MVNKWIRYYLVIANTTTLPKWLRLMNALQTIFAMLCVVLMKVQDEKERNIKHNEFVKNFRLVVRPIEIETPFGTIHMQEVTAVRREKKE